MSSTFGELDAVEAATIAVRETLAAVKRQPQLVDASVEAVLALALENAGYVNPPPAVFDD